MIEDGKLFFFIGEFVLLDDELGVVFWFDGKWDRVSEFS